MKRLIQGALVATVAALGIWGCAADPAGQATAERLRSVEAKHARLEEDFKAVCAARDQLRRKVADGDSAAARADAASLQVVELQRQREDLQADLRVRTDERDAVRAEFEAFRRGMRDLLGRADAAISPTALSAGGS